MVWHRFANGLHEYLIPACMTGQMVCMQVCHLREMVWIGDISLWIMEIWFGFWSN